MAAHPSPRPGPALPRGRAGWLLLAAGIIALAATAAVYVYFVRTHPPGWQSDPVDLRVYRQGGESVRHLAPWYLPNVKAPLYSWPGNFLNFTYPPFAALLFTIVSLPSPATMDGLAIGVNILAFLASIWFTLRGLDVRRLPVRIGATALAAAGLFWIEPVQRVLFLGQIELVLMALILWDTTQPDRRWWKGAGIGIAAGIKLWPLIFIPFLLLTGRFRQAAVAAGAFAATVAIGFAVLPADSDRWWLGGLFVKGDRTGFIAWAGNQSLRGLITRFGGSSATVTAAWLVAAAATAAIGLLCAAVLDRHGHRMLGVLTCALTALLISPVSWDHHWVWVVPAVTLAAVYGVRAIRQPTGPTALGLAALGLAAVVGLIFGAWPEHLWGELRDPGAYSRGLIWAPPNTNPIIYARRGDRRWYAEYHWHGLQLIVGNLYVLTGLALLGLLVLLAIRAARSPAGPGGPEAAGHSGPAGADQPGRASAQAEGTRLATPEA